MAMQRLGSIGDLSCCPLRAAEANRGVLIEPSLLCFVRNAEDPVINQSFLKKIAALAAPGMAQASLSTAPRPRLLHAARGTSTSLHIARNEPHEAIRDTRSASANLFLILTVCTLVQ